MSQDLIEAVDRVRDLAEMLASIRFTEVTNEAINGIHITITQIAKQLNHVSCLARAVDNRNQEIEF